MTLPKMCENAIHIYAFENVLYLSGIFNNLLNVIQHEPNSIIVLFYLRYKKNLSFEEVICIIRVWHKPVNVLRKKDKPKTLTAIKKFYSV